MPYLSLFLSLSLSLSLPLSLSLSLFVFLSLSLSFSLSPLPRYSKAQCFRGRRYGDKMEEWFLNFLDAHRNFTQDNLFTWIWHTDWSHDLLNGAKMADEPIKKLLQTMKVGDE